MNLKQQLKEAIEAAIKKADIVEEIPEVKVEVPKDKNNGDFSTNAAMMLTKLARKNPRDIAQAIIDNIDKEGASIKEVSIAGPGFINFKMETAELANVIYTVLDKKENYGRTERETAEKVLIEFVSANPTGDLHIGHARNASVGATLSNIMDFAGYDVTREYYINDAGNQINNLAKSIEARYFEALGEELNMPEDGYNGKDIKVIGEKLASEHPEYKDLEEAERISKFRDLGVEYEMRKLKGDLAEFRINFDNWFSETALYESGEIDEAMTKMKDNGYIFEAEGATWLRTTDFKDDKDRVLVKGDGTLTYLMPDIAYHYDKVERGFDKLINLFGADHHGYINRLKASLGALGENPDKLEIQIMQLVRLIENGEEVKMSKRTGKAVTLRDLIDMIGVDAARYFMIMRSTDTHFDFDLDLARSESSDNPVYYAQYAHARICSILRQAKEQGFEINTENPVDIIENEQALELLKKVLEFPNIVKGAAESRATQRIPNYIHDLAASFHKFYNAEKVLGENADKTRAYILMIEAVRQTLENALRLIDVSAPEKM
ncbi:arginine--tRNA ligase [Jeotgalicoccus coquinae]|uniref:Arginine--tRNA ligase n=1 Tax=Jeotgalicoccus coquinae TaxID=709509 RepID=A0A6V7RPN6_9STAP|nr:arginine--tRNA ligase [Jeotgalicoccus coquinae]MBB6423908.1 arginyl-tRNA synthetase [Jeotgalicoccus coquinae]GGE24043.1 arginine--tRNA ligase [Jeotgalicoccus coquinae]CAD2080506.1 Arginine--tRNA ligase [Jeotgalicoccus coquinae]